MNRIGMFTVTGALPGQSPKTLEFRPSDYPSCEEIAKALGQSWERHGRAASFATARTAHTGIVLFLKYLTREGITSWGEITPDVLRSYEVDISGQREHPARVTRHVWDFLRHQPKGTLNTDTATFVTHPPALGGKSSNPTEALPDDMMKAILRAAMRDVTNAETRLKGGAKYLTQQEITAFYLLLLWELKWPMDVLKDLSFTPNANTTVLDWNAGGGDLVLARWVKNRGGKSDIDPLRTDGTWSAGTLLRRLEAATRDAREIADRDDNTLPKGCPWLYLRTQTHGLPSPYPYVEGTGWVSPLFSLNSVFAAWLEAHEIEVPDGFDRVSFRSIRPGAKTARMTLVDNSGLNVVDLIDDHSIEVYSSRYTRSARLMRELGQVFLEDIAGRAEEVVRVWTPKVVASLDEAAEAGLSDDEASQALDGSLEFGLTACRTPTESPMPGEKAGDLCGLAFRACFTCPSAVVTPRHVKRMKAVREIAMNQRDNIPPPQWEGMWRDTVTFIDLALVKLEPSAADFEQVPEHVIDAGLMGAPSW